MKVGFITTIDTNIGDDFIRCGIENIVKNIHNTSSPHFTYVNKHLPETAIVNKSPIHLLKKSKPFPGRGKLMNFYDKYLYHYFSVYNSQDIIIQSGAPVLWPDCQNNEWAIPIWYKTIGKLHKKIPVLNIAAGSCYPWEHRNGFFNDDEKKYAADIGSFCKLTTTRDILANRLFTEAGVKNVLMPCSAFFVDQHVENKNHGEYILINYMPGGGHFDWGQNINGNAWEEAIKNLINSLGSKYEIHFICHNEKEVAAAQRIAPGNRIHLPDSVESYLEVIRKAIIGINNRMHASVAMASVGVPSLSIGTDTRLLMLENLGLPIFYVKDVSGQLLNEEVIKLIAQKDTERKRLFELKSSGFNKYSRLLETYFR